MTGLLACSDIAKQWSSYHQSHWQERNRHAVLVLAVHEPNTINMSYFNYSLMEMHMQNEK
jgi:phospholipase C